MRSFCAVAMSQGRAPTPWPVLMATNVVEIVLHTVRTLACGAALRNQRCESRVDKRPSAPIRK